MQNLKDSMMNSADYDSIEKYLEASFSRNTEIELNPDLEFNNSMIHLIQEPQKGLLECNSTARNFDGVNTNLIDSLFAINHLMISPKKDKGSKSRFINSENENKTADMFNSKLMADTVLNIEKYLKTSMMVNGVYKDEDISNVYCDVDRILKDLDLNLDDNINTSSFPNQIEARKGSDAFKLDEQIFQVENLHNEVGAPYMQSQNEQALNTLSSPKSRESVPAGVKTAPNSMGDLQSGNGKQTTKKTKACNIF